jgi:hypothetical protein
VTRGAAVREARPEDNDALIALSAACSMDGALGVRIERSPDFFAVSRALAAPTRVGVVDGPDGLLACITVSRRRLHLWAEPRDVVHVSDLKVRKGAPAGAADALSRFAVEACRDFVGPRGLAVCTVLAGNRPMTRRAHGPRGLPILRLAGRFRTYSVPLLPVLPRAPRELSVEPAVAGDVPEMIGLWRTLAPQLQLSPVLDEACFARWLAAAPSLELSDYWVAREPGGALRGFVGLWDQRAFRQLRVTSYPWHLRVGRGAFNALAFATAGARLPPRGGVLGCIAAVHPCVPLDEPRVLRTLLLRAAPTLRDEFTLITLGLDARDTRASALSGLFATAIDANVYVSSASGEYAGPPLDARLFHHELALL